MDIQRLRYFLAVAEELHFGRAAERLLVTPSPLSKQIRQLEREMGGDLFIRDYHSVRLTPLGKTMLEPVRDIVNRVDALRDLAGPKAARLRIGATPLAPPSILDKSLKVISELACDIPIETHLAPTVQLIPKLETRKLDFALVFEPVPTESIASFPVGFIDQLVVVLNEDPLAGRDHLVLEDLASGTMAVPTYNYHPEHLRQLKDRLREAGVTDQFEVPGDGHLSLAMHVRLHGLRALVSDLDDYPARSSFPPDTYSLIPLRDLRMRKYVSVAAHREALRSNGAVRAMYRQLRARLGLEATETSREIVGTSPEVSPAS